MIYLYAFLTISISFSCGFVLGAAWHRLMHRTETQESRYEVCKSCPLINYGMGSTT
jgi:DNA-directed RNA polymerase subunit N (RpoN/RPB10)